MRKAMRRALWLGVLVISFVLVFGLVLAIDAGVIGGKGGTELSQVASANYWKKNGEITKGEPNPIKVSNSDNVTMDNMDFDSANLKFTYQLNASSVDPDLGVTNGTEPNNLQLYKQGGNTSVLVEKPSTGQWRVGVGNTPVDGYNFVVALCFESPQVIQTLMEHNNEVKASVTFRYVSHTDWIGNDLYYKSTACSKSNLPKADGTFATNAKSQTVTTPKCNENATIAENKTLTTTEITLSKNNNCVSLIIGFSFPKHGTGFAWATGHNRLIVFDSMKINYSIVVKNEDDGAAPVLTKEFISGATEAYSPIVTDVNNLPVCYDVIKTDTSLTNRLDQVTYGNLSTTNKLYSYIHSDAGVITVNSSQVNYYKKIQLQFNDAYDYSYPDSKVFTTANRGKSYAGIGRYYYSSGWSSQTSTTHYVNKMSSGIKTVEISLDGVSKQKLDMDTEADYGASTFKSISVGYAAVTKTSQNQVTVTVYMTDNGKVDVKVSDYGSYSCKKTIDVQGIDKTAPANYVSVSGVSTGVMGGSKSSVENIAWIKQSTASFTLGDAPTSSAYNQTPYDNSAYLWFYTVRKAATKAELQSLNELNAYTKLVTEAGKSNGTKNWTPIAFKTMTTFEFDFSTGMAKGYGSSTYNAGNPSDITGDSNFSAYTSNVTGSGYYLFTFYVMDLAGNVSGTAKHFYVKVDIDTPEYTVNLSYLNGNRADAERVDISSSQNGKWATGETTLEIRFEKVNLSGNSLKFSDSDGKVYYLVFDRWQAEQKFMFFTGNVTGEEGAGTVNIEGDTSNPKQISSILQNPTLQIKYEDFGDNGAKLIFTFVDEADENGSYPTIAWIAEFISYVGAYRTDADVRADSAVISFVSTEWKNGSANGVQVLVDRNTPEAPELVDSDEYLQTGTNGYSIKFEERKWFTSNTEYKLKSQLTFNDYVASDNTYGGGVNIYYGIACIRNADELLTLKNKNIEANYPDIKSKVGYFDSFVTINAKGRRPTADETLDLIQSFAGGMRVVYAWSVDQAGNCSELHTYYVLADAQVYTVNARAVVNDLLKVNGQNTASVTAKGADGKPSASFRRGDTITFDITMWRNSAQDEDAAIEFVPFRFILKAGEEDDGVIVLENYSTERKWTKTGSEYDEYISFEDMYGIDFMLDSSDNLGAMRNRSLTFSLMHRKVVSYQITESNVPYTEEPAIVPMSFGDVNSASHFVYRYVDADNNIIYVKEIAEDGSVVTTLNAEEALVGSDGMPTCFVPVLPGNYYVRIFIPRSDEVFITNDYRENADGDTVFEKNPFSIRKGEAVVKAKTSVSDYGDIIRFDDSSYTVEGYSGTVTSGSLRLAYTGWVGENTLVPAGTYDVIQDSEFYINEYYNVTFEKGSHTVAKRTVTVSTWAQNKQYGDKDPQFIFSVAETEFGWYLERSIDGSANVSDIIEEVFAAFGSYTAETLDGTVYYLFSVGKTYIEREDGDHVGTYEYTVHREKFDLGSNYTLAVRPGQSFTITKRTVVLDVSGQFVVLPENTVPNLDEIVPSYVFDTNNLDEKYVNEINSLLARVINGERMLALDPNSMITLGSGEFDSSKYKGGQKYSIALYSDEEYGAGNENIGFSLGGDIFFIIYFADSLILKVNAGAVFAAMFGTPWNADLLTYGQYRSSFEVTADPSSDKVVPTFDDISWTVTLKGVNDGAYASVGSYQVIISDVVLKLNGEDVIDPTTGLAYSVVANGFSFQFTPAPVTVRPTASIEDGISYKTYGEPESVFGIGFEIVSVGGKPVDEFLAPEGLDYTYEKIMQQIYGSFERAQFASTGLYRESGTRYSSATDENGFVIGTDGDYYAFRVNNEFSSGDKNFTVSAQTDDSTRFRIRPKEISLNASNFVGVSKSYDGGTSVSFGRTTAYSISDQLVNSDDVSLGFDAEYAGIGSMESQTETEIIFSNITLNGAKAGNYVLTTISRNSNFAGKITVGGETAYGERNITADLKVYILYINNIDNEDRITIYMGRIAMFKSDIVITKSYDGTTSLGIGAVSVKDRPNDDKGYGVQTLVQVWKSGKMQILNNVEYSNTSVSSNYVIGEIVLFFELEGAGGLQIINGNEELDENGDYSDKDITIVADDSGVTVRIRNIRASITKRVLNETSFESISAVNRAYNARSSINTVWELKKDALAEGDNASSVGLTLRAEIDDTSVGYGQHRIKFMPLGSDASNTTIKSVNYSIDIEALNLYYYSDRAITVNISRAQLIPNVVFKDDQYNGAENVAFEIGKSGLQFTTLAYAEELSDELRTFGFDSDKVKYVLSENGAINVNVITDELGNILRHNVMICGLKITENSGRNYLSNYEIYGSRYIAGAYRAVGSVTANTEIANYEIIDAIMLSRRKVQLLVNNVTVKEKVYDGTKDAEINVSLEESGVLPEEIKYFYVSARGTFAKSIVSSGTIIIIDNVVLNANEGSERYLNNYELVEYTERRTASILPRPVGVTVRDGSGIKTYDGLPKISNSLMSYDIFGLMESEASGYIAQAGGGAYFFDKDVEIDENNQVTDKTLVVFDPILKNNRGKSNYVPMFSTEKKVGEDYIAYEIGGKLFYKQKYNGSASVTYFYELPTVDKYISLTDTDKYDDALDAGAIVGRYAIDGKEVYAVKSTYTGNVSGTMNAMTYITAMGRINKKSVYISPNGIEIIEGSTAFTKMFDGTNTFFGKEKEDFKYIEGSISGVVESDRSNVGLFNIRGEFDSADTTANYVVFTADGINGTAANNYYVEGGSASARIRATITKRTINSYLADGTMVYGDNVSSVVGDVTYFAVGNDFIVEDENGNAEKDEDGNVCYEHKEYALDLWDGGLYMLIAEYAEMNGFKVTVYQSDENMTLYNKLPNGGYSVIEKTANADVDWSTVYIKLSGVQSFPTAKAVFKVSKPGAGSAAESYTLVGGNAVNYSFRPVYGSETSGKTSGRLEVLRKDLFVATDGADYTLIYGGSTPSVMVYYFDKNGNDGIASSETANTVFRVNGKDYFPIVKFGIYNTLTKEIKEISKYPQITLGANQIYVVYFEKPEVDEIDKNGDRLTYEDIISNYTVHFGESFGNVGGKLVMQYGSQFGNTTFASSVTVELPRVSGVSLGNAESNVYHVTYDGTNLTGSALSGDVRSSDDLFIEDEDGNILTAVNAGTYYGYIKLRRAVTIDDGDFNGYSALWTSPTKVYVVVDKASPKLAVASSTKYYDNEKFEYTVSGGNNMITYVNVPGLINKGDAVISYYKLMPNGEYDAVREMRNAGTYRVRVQLTDAWADAHTNYSAESAIATFTILRLVVNVSLEDNRYAQSESENGLKLFGTVYEQGKTEYDINYSVSMPSNVASSIGITKDQTNIVFEKAITASGRYAFTVEITDCNIDKNNYNLVGANGILELTTNRVEAPNASVELGSAIVANRVVAHEVNTSVATASDIDLWTKVDKYMPYISDQASLAAIVRVSVYHGNQVVNLNGTTAIVAIDLPENAKNLNGIAIYEVSSDGKSLNRITDYVITEDGKLQYSTDHLGDLVFVDLNPSILPLWAMILIISAGGAFVLTLLVAAVCLIIRKVKLRKIM